MRVPPIEIIGRWLRGIGLLISGAIIGAAVFMAIYQYNYNILVTENVGMRTKIKQLEENLANSEKYRNETIKSVEVHFVQDDGLPEDKVIQSRIEGLAWADLKEIWLGKDVEDFEDFQDIKKLYARRFNSVVKNDYEVRIDSFVVVYSNLHVWITVKEVTDN